MTDFDTTTDPEQDDPDSPADYPGTCPACDKPVSAVEKRQLPLDGTTFPDTACLVDSDELPATVSVKHKHPEFRPDVAVVTHLAGQ